MENHDSGHSHKYVLFDSHLTPTSIPLRISSFTRNEFMELRDRFVRDYPSADIDWVELWCGVRFEFRSAPMSPTGSSSFIVIINPTTHRNLDLACSQYLYAS